ncbi:MAG: glucose-6-phosphate isomerase [Dehalococcoidia bacterium]
MNHWRTLVSEELAKLECSEVVAAVWERSQSAWGPPSEGGALAAEATGWLDLPVQISALIDGISTFVTQVRKDGFSDLIVIGMGGSSLGALVLGRTLGSSPGYLRLHVLDSTIPGQIKTVRDQVDLERTLVLVSSKSGTTIEPLKLAEYFHGEMKEAGIDDPYSQFIAITDHSTSLETKARDCGFKKVFAGPPGVGGRFSVLSNFGLLPAALIGVDLKKVQRTALLMAALCQREIDVKTNPGAMLGATLGGLAAIGKDKVTVLTSPSINSLGLWIEQLLAESTGKNGKGLIPIVEEPLHNPSDYGDDRNFIYLRLAGEDNARTDAHVELLEANGHPITRLDLNDRYDIAAEFFRWEFAVAVAATILSVYPFDQPNVETGKKLTDSLLSTSKSAEEIRRSIPLVSKLDEVIDLILQAKQRDYIAILGYLPESYEMSQAISELRIAITKCTGSATTFGYGPRYLHSTGQLHKGGPASVIGLVLMAGSEKSLASPRLTGDIAKKDSSELEYGFESLFMAQIVGDLQALQENGLRNTIAVLQAPYPTAVQTITTLLRP